VRRLAVPAPTETGLGAAQEMADHGETRATAGSANRSPDPVAGFVRSRSDAR